MTHPVNEKLFLATVFDFFSKSKDYAIPTYSMDSDTLNQEGPWTKEKLKLWSPNFQKSLP